MDLTTSWHHAPPHWIEEKGIYIVTGSTLHKKHMFRDTLSRDVLRSLFFDGCREFGWNLHAWAIFSNHYHFIGESPDDPKTMNCMLSKLHMLSAKWINRQDNARGRKVWFQFWETRLTYSNSYWPRIRYVHENPVKHGLVKDATDYPWCSAGWFVEKAPSQLQRKVLSYKTDRLQIYDDY